MLSAIALYMWIGKSESAIQVCSVMTNLAGRYRYTLPWPRNTLLFLLFPWAVRMKHFNGGTLGSPKLTWKKNGESGSFCRQKCCGVQGFQRGLYFPGRLKLSLRSEIEIRVLGIQPEMLMDFVYSLWHTYLRQWIWRGFSLKKTTTILPSHLLLPWLDLDEK
jgi:hypothetical protein